MSGFPRSLTPTGAASGDLAGTYPGPSVARLQGGIVLSGAAAAGDVLTATAANAAHWAAPAGGGLLAVVQVVSSQHYILNVNPGPTDIDAANMVVTFNAPASGNAVVQTQFLYKFASGSIQFRLREGASTVSSNDQDLGQTGGVYVRKTITFPLSGLAAGAHTLKLAYVATGGSGGDILINNSGATDDATFLVLSAP